MFTDAPEIENVAISAVTSVATGTERTMLVPVIVPVAEGEVKSKAVRSFALFGATVTVTV
jgi:hypothetical protein